MEFGLSINVVPDASHGVIRAEQLGTRSAADRNSVRLSRSDDLMAVEAEKLLADNCLALDNDLGNASTMAGSFAALLASKLSRDHCSAGSRGGLAPWQKRRIQSYIEERLEATILITDLARRVSLSAGYFRRAFKQSFGESPHTYIVGARIERAKKLMLTTPESLSQIALACGLSDQSHLCRTFRQATGTTPGGWRLRHTGGLSPAARLKRNAITPATPRLQIKESACSLA